MEVGIREQILAIITTNREKVSGSVPIFFVNTNQEAEHLGLLLSRILKAMVHDLENGIYILVKH